MVIDTKIERNLVATKKIPENAVCVFHGKIFQVWQWEQKMFDGSTQIFEYVQQVHTSLVIPVVGDKVMVQLEEQPHDPVEYYALPGGWCEWDEDPFDAAKRELLEESGYVSDDWILWKEQHLGHQMLFSRYVYIARNCIYKQPPKFDAGEKITQKLLSFDEFLNLHNNPLFQVFEVKESLDHASHSDHHRKELCDLFFGFNEQA